jgi:hypothetical protein
VGRVRLGDAVGRGRTTVIPADGFPAAAYVSRSAAATFASVLLQTCLLLRFGMEYCQQSSISLKENYNTCVYHKHAFF